MNCKYHNAEIEETVEQKSLSAAALEHLESCAVCRTFRQDREKLRQMLLSLPLTTAPADFNFHVKARLRKQETSRSRAVLAVLTWRRVLLFAPTALTVLIIGVVLINSFFLAPQQPDLQKASAIVPVQQSEQLPSPQLSLPDAVIADAQPSQLNSDQEISAPTIRRSNIHRQIAKAQLVRREAQVSLASLRLRKNKDTEEISVRDSAPTNSSTLSLSPARPPIMPPGFDNPLAAAPRVQNGKDLLQTFGVETIAETDKLRVVSVKADSQGTGADLRADDLIEKINGENPMAVKSREFKQLTLTIRRQTQTQEIRIVPKP